MIDIGRDLQNANDEGYIDGYDDGFNNGYDEGYRKRDFEIVRCKDCKHWDDVPIADGRLEDHECHLIDGNKNKIRIVTPSDWFCPAGERREQ